MSRYPEDEFDIAARNRGPKGVHRQGESAWRRLLPFLVVLIAAPLLAWGALSLLNQDREEGTPVAVPTVTPTATPTVTPEPTTTEPTAPEETGTPEPTPGVEVDFAAPVAVLNGAGVSGIAARTADRLVGIGFTTVSAANYANAQPTVSTIFYNNAELAPTAEAIGAELGIDTLVELSSATNSLAVVLRSDFQE